MDTLTILLIAGSPCGVKDSLAMSLASASDVVIAVDKGADTCFSANITPDYFCGDADSISSRAYSWIMGSTTRTKIYPCEKDDTDLSLAFTIGRKLALEAGCVPRILLCCASGGRPDHALGVFGVMAKNSDMAPVMCEDGFRAYVLSPFGCDRWQATQFVLGHTLSVLALRDNTCVSEKGLKWELDKKRMDSLCDLGVSNVIESDEAEVICHEGVCAVFVLD